MTIYLTHNDCFSLVQCDKIFIKEFDYYSSKNPKEYKTGIVICNENDVPFADVIIELIETNWRKFDPNENIFSVEKRGVLADNSHFINCANGKKFGKCYAWTNSLPNSNN
ncbi:MAG TPA: hypothetical protein G4N92_07890 [Anaerolineae bacterium]|nr:hypothetical protein [Anaerolineae bacterium]